VERGNRDGASAPDQHFLRSATKPSNSGGFCVRWARRTPAAKNREKRNQTVHFRDNLRVSQILSAGLLNDLDARPRFGGCGLSPGRLSSMAMSEVTRILSLSSKATRHAAEQLLPLVYDELRKLAAQKMAQEAAGQTLQATVWSTKPTSAS